MFWSVNNAMQEVNDVCSQKKWSTRILLRVPNFSQQKIHNLKGQEDIYCWSGFGQLSVQIWRQTSIFYPEFVVLKLLPFASLLLRLSASVKVRKAVVLLSVIPYSSSVRLSAVSHPGLHIRRNQKCLVVINLLQCWDCNSKKKIYAKT